MANLNAFLGTFLSYLIVFLVFVVLAVVGCIAGIKWRKAKEEKARAQAQHPGEGA